MKLPLYLRSEALDDANQATKWYEQQSIGLGRQFMDRLNDVLDRIQQFPKLHAVEYQNVRLTRVPGFPYLVC